MVVLKVLCAFMLFLSGCMFAVRIFKRLREENIFFPHQLVTFSTLAALLAIAVVIWVQDFRSIFLIFMAVLVLSSGLGPLLRVLREKRFAKEILPFLNQIILHMRSGKAFRGAMKAAIHEDPVLDGFYKIKFAEIYEAVVFSGQAKIAGLDRPRADLIHALRAADQAPHNCLQRLLNLRRKLQIASDFRRKSGQILLQIRMQAVILSVLYFALLVFTIWQNGTKSFLWLLVGSFSLFATGVAVLSCLGRKVKWKI